MRPLFLSAPTAVIEQHSLLKYFEDLECIGRSRDTYGPIVAWMKVAVNDVNEGLKVQEELDFRPFWKLSEIFYALHLSSLVHVRDPLVASWINVPSKGQ
jgi:hypothetical protein